MENMIFKSDSYVSLPAKTGALSGDVFLLGDLVGVYITGEGQGVGNQPGFASVALEGGVRVNVPAGTAYNVGDTVYATAGTGVVTKTATGNVRLGKVTHEPKTATAGAGSVIIKIVQ
jgi:predicted RecA/RadA family phage recombinase